MRRSVGTATVIAVTATMALTGCVGSPFGASPGGAESGEQTSDNCTFALAVKETVDAQLASFIGAINAGNGDAAAAAVDSISSAGADLSDFANADAFEGVYIAARGSASGIERWVDVADRNLSGDPRITTQVLLDETDTLRSTLATINTACS